MIKLGEMNKLKIARAMDGGYFLDAGSEGEIYLPAANTTKPHAPDEWVEVFVYLDSENRLTATTKKPLGQVNSFAFLKVAQVNQVGAFLEWGLPKDILAPYSEQKFPMEEGDSCIVFIYLDNSGRIAASSKIDRFLKSLNDDFETGQKVELLVESATSLGYKCIVNQTHWGILHENEVFRPLAVGQVLPGYIQCIRDDKKIDLCLHPPGYERVDAVTDKILAKLMENDGFLAVNDKSDPSEIYALFEISKQVFKKAVGALYKRRLITLEVDGIRTAPKPAKTVKTGKAGAGNIDKRSRR